MKPGTIKTALYATVLTAASVLSSGCGRLVDWATTEPTSATYEGKYIYQVETVSETGEKTNEFIETDEDLTTWMPEFTPFGSDVLFIDSVVNEGRKNEFKKRFVDVEYHTDPGLDAVVTWKGPNKVKTLISPETLSAPGYGPLSDHMRYVKGERIIDTDPQDPHPLAGDWMDLEREYNKRLICSISESISEVFRED